jgi:predicted aspartyl protease
MIGSLHFLSEARVSVASRSWWPTVNALGRAPRGPQRPWRQRLFACGFVSLALLFTSGATLVHSQYAPSAEAVTVPARIVADFFIVEARVAGEGPFTFVVDTGSSVSLVSPVLARRVGLTPGAALEIRSPSQRATNLPTVTLPRLELGAASFSEVRAAVFDFGDLSRQLGTRVDGIIGFPVFRDVVFTIDYPARRLVIDPQGSLTGRVRDTIDCHGDGDLPLASVDVGGRRVIALIDTGSDSALVLNSRIEAAQFVRGSRRGSVRATVSGDEPQFIGRLAADVRIGSHRVEKPVVEMADGLPSLGSGVLKHFAVTFDPRHQRMTLRRDASSPVQIAAQRSVGLGFVRGATDWRVAAVVPDTPAGALDIRVGDRCVRINGEPASHWPLERYQSLLRTSQVVTFTFASATGRATELRLPVVDLVQ